MPLLSRARASMNAPVSRAKGCNWARARCECSCCLWLRIATGQGLRPCVNAPGV